MLEKIIVDEAGKPAVEAINLGVPAADTKQVADRLEHFLRGSSLPPDVVLFSAGVNNLSHWAFYECLVQDEMIAPTFGERLNHFLGRHSFWVRLVVVYAMTTKTHSLAFLSYPSAYDIDPGGQLHMKNADLENAVRHCLLADYERLTQLIRQAGALPVVVTYHEGWFITDVQRRFADSRHVILVDVPAHAAACGNPDSLQYHYPREWHPNFQGYLEIAYFAANDLLQQESLRARRLRLAPYSELQPGLIPLLKPEMHDAIHPPCEAPSP